MIVTLSRGCVYRKSFYASRRTCHAWRRVQAGSCSVKAANFRETGHGDSVIERDAFASESPVLLAEVIVAIFGFL